jgi:hypothetical protein
MSERRVGIVVVEQELIVNVVVFGARSQRDVDHMHVQTKRYS